MYKLLAKFDDIMKSGRFDKLANKFLATFLLVPSLAYAGEINVRNIDHTTVMTKDSMIILDKREGKFWKTDLNCQLPLDTDSKVSFKTAARTIKEGSELTFIIGSKPKDKHNCKVVSLASL